MSEQRYSGGCLCGRVRFEVSGPAGNLCYCHCSSCRRAAGAPLVAWGTFPRASFHLTQGELTEYRSSPPVLRGFCAACGGAVTYRHEARDREIDVTLASLDGAATLAPQMHVWVGEKLPWVRIGDDLPQFAAGTGAAQADVSAPGPAG
jgi:hypothetical protein